MGLCVGGGGLPFLPGLPSWTCMATLASSGRVAPHYSRPSVQAKGASLYCPLLYLSGTFSSCQRGAFSHFFRLFSTFGLMHQNIVPLGGGYVYAFRNL